MRDYDYSEPCGGDVTAARELVSAALTALEHSPASPASLAAVAAERADLDASHPPGIGRVTGEAAWFVAVSEEVGRVARHLAEVQHETTARQSLRTALAAVAAVTLAWLDTVPAAPTTRAAGCGEEVPF